jgi:hypothetical protein
MRVILLVFIFTNLLYSWRLQKSTHYENNDLYSILVWIYIYIHATLCTHPKQGLGFQKSYVMV